MRRRVTSVACALAILILAGDVGLGQDRESASLVRYGGMHEALAMGHHQARVRLAELLDQEHFFGVGALEGLKGEITILDSVVFATGVTAAGRPVSRDGASAAATLLVGQSVPRWSVVRTVGDVTPDRFDDVVREGAAEQGVDPTTPFMFVIEGELTDVRLHVINGACPLHARMNRLELADDEKPYERDVASIRGTVVGVYAADAVGKLTHPATRTHAHLIFVDEETGQQVTGHLERAGIAAGATLEVPAAANSGGMVGDR